MPPTGHEHASGGGLQVPDRAPASHTRSLTPRSRAAAGSPLVVHSGPTAVPSAVDIQRLAWVCGGGWGLRTQCGRPDTFGGYPARPQWARRAIGRGRGPDHSIGAQSVAPGYGRPRSRKMGWAGTGPVPGPGASRPWLRRCARPPSRGPRTRVAELTPCLGAPIVAVSHSRVN